jgi:hypothetical protein
MDLKSIALKTNLILDNCFASIIEHDEYLVVRSKNRPEYIWGNYLIMKSSPKKGDYKNWINLFEKEFGTKNEKGFVAITFDTLDGSNSYFEDFRADGFDIQISKILIAKEVNLPPKMNSGIEIRPFSSESDWERYIDIHFTPNWGYGSDSEQKRFLKEEMNNFKKFTLQKNAKRFGAFLNGEMIAELGVYWKDGIARFNNVATHRNYRRIGACNTLVYHVSCFLLEKADIHTLVMEADEDYHAAKIYESVGFKPSQKLIAFEWVDENRY